MPYAGSNRPSGNARFAVGKPSLRPRSAPCITSPHTSYGRPNSSAAWSTAPSCASKDRMRLLRTGSPCQS